jgi:hypothetical protein
MMMTSKLGGHRAPSLFLFTAVLTQGVACGGDDGGDETTLAGTTSSTDPTTATDSTEGASDPSAAESSGAPGTSSDDGVDGSSSSTATEGGETTDGDTTTGDTTAGDALAINGTWADDFGGVHEITDDAWIQTYGPDAYPYTIASYDNAERVVIAEDDGDMTWSKFEWTYDGDDVLYYCQSAFGEASAEDAAAAPDADPAEPAASGCGGFAWSRLTAAR